MNAGPVFGVLLEVVTRTPSLWAAGSSKWHYLLWGGLATMLIAPAVLSRTRWSESRPLATCVGVSVMAHLLMMIYAYTTRLPYAEFRGPGEGDGGIVSLNLLADEELPDDGESDDTGESSANEPAEDMLPRPDETAGERSSTGDQPEPTDADATNETITDTMTEASTVPDDSASRPNGPDAEIRVGAPPAPPVAGATIPAMPLPAAAGLANHSGDQSTVPEAAEIDAADLKADQQDSQGAAPPAPSPAELADALVTPSPEAVAAATAAAAMHMVARSMPSDEPMDISPMRPGDGRPVPVLYRNRQSSRRLSIALQHGGNATTEAAVNTALEWLARHQSPDGRWDADAHGAGQEARIHGHDRGGAGAHADTGVTALAILAFLGAGETHLVGPHREHVQHGLEFLLRNQRTDGELAGSAELFARMYCHSMATLALSEAYAMTGDPRIRPFLDRAVRYSLAAQDQATGGWRYRPGDAGDMSQFGWQLMALKSAQQAGLDVPDSTWVGMRRFVDSVTSGPQRGLASYRPGERPSRTMTAEALLCRVFLDMHQERQVKEAMAFVLQELPNDRAENFYYWYYATLAAFQTQGDGWPAWNDALQRQLLARQRTTGDAAGSWDPDTVWGNYGGRVFSTSLGALCLEVYYRYLPLYQTAASDHVVPGERR